MEAIILRRSVRDYLDKAIPDDLITELLEAGMCAPSAGNERPWHFVVLTERSLMEGITKFHPHSKMLKHAPAAIIVCADLNRNKYPGVDYWVQDCAAATENILIAAQAKGLGACWLGMYPREERVEGLRRLLKTPQHIVPFSGIALGYPASAKNPGPRYDETRVHRNGW
ncbi:nitroreductase family protein [Pelotomaculum propionicicum]|uniref:Oxygen-insensitive NADPH nitroreductase n=1 Tax=Pelotomaculum propionicicum TaxID=258475 RepID=A0A4Y7RNA9_9FIRM|nr:nitroreductase family protein [Pelotomaculum propionicicum]NLI12648.1 nitroreductase family protein [Peptococcaceae bacterium]TEB09777.1 Oxygen-insensitive NADPH nitroreductase [Pelotomaculum propionicicum]